MKEIFIGMSVIVGVIIFVRLFVWLFTRLSETNVCPHCQSWWTEYTGTYANVEYYRCKKCDKHWRLP